MARIRTIKPEFFTSEDIVSLQPLTRLLYIAIWCEADKEGRLVWKPATFKLRYFPGDSCDIQAMCQELIQGGLVKLYGEGYAVIPSFKAHQHINPRETESQLPEPVAITTRGARVGTRQPRDSDAQGGREGKGKEGNDGSDSTKKSSPKSELPAEFYPNDAGIKAAEVAGFDVKAELVKFRDHHEAHGSKFSDWQAAFRTWIRKAIEFRGSRKPAMPAAGDKPSWLDGTGFTDIFEANNAGCYAHNADKFRSKEAA